MSKTLTKEEVLALAHLSRLELSENEVKQFQKELGSILEYVEQLGSADTEGVEPTSQVTGLVNMMRPDKVQKQLATPEELLLCAPKTRDGYIEVKRMI